MLTRSGLSNVLMASVIAPTSSWSRWPILSAKASATALPKEVGSLSVKPARPTRSKVAFQTSHPFPQKLTVCEIGQSHTASQATDAVEQRPTLQTKDCCRAADQHNSMQMALVI